MIRVNTTWPSTSRYTGSCWGVDGDLNATERSTLIGLHKRICFAFLLAGFLAFPRVSFPALPASRQAKAVATFERAVRMKTTLESLPENTRTKADYQKVIETFQEVARLDPAYAKAPTALASVAELYEGMGRVFSADRYYLKSVKTYQFLVSEYPHSQIARDALFTLGETYSTDLGNPEEARKTFQKFLDKYPKSSKAEEAQAKIEEIDQLHAERAPRHSAPHRETAESRRGNGLPEVTEVRRWVGPNYSRIVIGVDEEVKFETKRLSKPDRIVLDIENARLSPALVGRTFPVEDGFLRQIRVGQFTSSVTRVVLDVEKIEDYSVLPLPNPFRLVVDIHGGSTLIRETERAAKESTARPATARPQRLEESSTATKQPASSSEPAQKPEVATRSTQPKPERETTGKARAPGRRRKSRRPPSSPPKHRQRPARRGRHRLKPRRRRERLFCRKPLRPLNPAPGP